MPKWIFLGVLLHTFIFSTFSQSIATPDGYAGYAGTTGGGNAARITVTTPSAFKSAVNNNDAAVIIVKGNLNLGGTVSIGSNKTIIGENESAGLSNGSLSIQGTNYIIQNLTIGPASGDVMEVSGATRVFIHKCTFHDSSDELLSIVRGADNVTVSWCKFFFNNPNSHSFAHLIGNSDDRTSDRGKLHVTMHHNWYAEEVVERMPRVRFGHVHIYNNYYNSVGNNYCIGTGKECHIRVENTHFDNVSQPWYDWGGSTTGVLGWDNLKFDNSQLPTYFTNTYPSFELPYSYSLDAVENVKHLVTAGAGNVFGEINANAPQVEITTPTETEEFTEPASITLIASASDDGTITKVEFYSADSLIGTATREPFSITWMDIPQGEYIIEAKATDNENNVTTSSAHRIIVKAKVLDNMTSLQTKIYPNLAAHELIIQLSNTPSQHTDFTLYNSVGKKVINQRLFHKKTILDISNLPAGIYLSSIKSDSSLITQKLIKP